MRTPIIIMIATFSFITSGCGLSEDDIKAAISTTPVLYTVECDAQIAVTSTDEDYSVFKIFGNRSAILPITAHIKAGIDFSKISKISINGNVVTITLPPPVIEIESTKILYEDIETDVTGFRDNYSDNDFAAYARVGRGEIEKNLYNLDIVKPAQENAKLVIAGIVSRLGYTVIFSREPEYTPEQLVNMIKR